MSTKRQTIQSFRKKLKEYGADTSYTDQDIYHALFEQAKWLIKREITSGRIYSNNSFFQTLGCQEVIETSTVEDCCPVKVNCRIYRTKDKLPDMWVDNKGPVIQQVTSVDGSTDFFLVTPMSWQNKKVDPYQKMSNMKYAFFAENYLWFPEHNPHRVNINGFYTDDISNKSNCHKVQGDCPRYLDSPFPLPGWLHAEMMTKALQVMMPGKQMPEDAQIDKNANRKN